jgi:hypothetical protein
MGTVTNETIRAVRIPAGPVLLPGDLIVPTRASTVLIVGELARAWFEHHLFGRHVQS